MPPTEGAQASGERPSPHHRADRGGSLRFGVSNPAWVSC